MEQNWQRFFATCDDIVSEMEQNHPGVMALGYALRAESAETVEEALEYKRLSDKWREIARIKHLIRKGKEQLDRLDAILNQIERNTSDENCQ